MTVKICTKCKKSRALSDFEKDSRYKSGYRPLCRSCRYDGQLDARLERHLMAKYSLTLAQYHSLVKKQKGLCAICKKPETRVVKRHASKYKSTRPLRLVVDHDHKTGKVRGLLCAKCNLGIGHLQDDIALLQSAVKYLRKHS